MWCLRRPVLTLLTPSNTFRKHFWVRSTFEIQSKKLINSPINFIDKINFYCFFCVSIAAVLKDVPNSPHQMIKDPSQDHVRMSAYPNLEYGNLYNALAMLLDVAPNIQFGLNGNSYQNNQFYRIFHNFTLVSTFSVFGKAVLQCLGCILPFLEKDLIDNIPYLVASSISVLPVSLHQDIINSLCFYILPFTITRTSSYDDQECHSCQSVSAVIMLVFQYSNNPAHHCQLLECLMALKQNVVKDMLINIAYGTSLSRSSAAKLLFYYWPAFNANLFDRRGLLFKFTSKQFYSPSIYVTEYISSLPYSSQINANQIRIY